MKLCVIGNSHVAALRDGWGQLRDAFPDVDVTFYAGPARIPQRFQSTDTIITPEDWNLKRFWRVTSGVSSKLDVAAHDAFLIHAYIYLPLDLDTRHSEAVRRLAARIAIERQAGWPLVKLIRNVTAAPIILGHRPLPLKPAGELPSPWYPTYDDLMSLLDDAVGVEGVTLLRQPAATRDDDRYTVSGFERGGTDIRPDKDGSGLPMTKPDGQHMNPDFGAQLMSSVVAALAAKGR